MGVTQSDEQVALANRGEWQRRVAAGSPGYAVPGKPAKILTSTWLFNPALSRPWCALPLTRAGPSLRGHSEWRPQPTRYPSAKESFDDQRQ